MRVPAAVVLGFGLLVGCGEGGSPVVAPEATTTTVGATDAVDVCTRAQQSVGSFDPPTDLAGVAADAARIADLATAPDEPLRSALQAVSDAAVRLTEAARAGDAALVADASATLSAAYDELDAVAATLERPGCSSESWGRQVAIAAIELVGAGG